MIKLGAGRATFINNTYVIWGALLAAWVLKERLRPSLIIGGVLALVGLSLLTNVLGTGTPPGFYERFLVHELVGAGLILGGTAFIVLLQPERTNVDTDSSLPSN